MNAHDKAFRRFLIIWSGQMFSAIGSGLTAFALGVFVFQQTQSTMSYSFIILFSFLPSFLLLPFSGVLADRFDRKKMMIIGDSFGRDVLTGKRAHPTGKFSSISFFSTGCRISS